MKLSNRLPGCLITLITWLPLPAQAQGIRIEPGAHIVMNGDCKLILQNAGFMNSGGFACDSGTVIFATLELPQHVIIGGSASTVFNNIVINRPLSLVQLQTDISVNGMLSMQAGNLELNRYRLTLGANSKITGENIHSYITGQKGGTIVITAGLNRPHEVNPGNIGVALTSTADLGSTTIIRGHTQQLNVPGKQGIYRYYEIKPAINSNANVSLRFHYLENELNNNNESDLVVWSRTDAASGWTALNKDRHDIAANWIARNEVLAPTRYTFGSSNNSLSRAKPGANIPQPVTQQFIQAYPNPVRNMVTLVIRSEHELQGTITLQDEYGRVLERKQITYIIGLNTIHWNIGKYAAGVYYLAFENAGGKIMKIVKQ